MSKPIIHGGSALIDPVEVLNQLEIKDRDIIADLGCGGGGHFISALANMVGPNGKVFAVDIQRNVLDTISSKLRIEQINNVETVWSNLEIYNATKIKNGSLDQALIINVLFQNKKYLDILKESSRMLKPGGKLTIIDWKTSGSPFGPPVELRISPEILKDLAGQVSLKFWLAFDAGLYHYALVFVKE